MFDILLRNVMGWIGILPRTRRKYVLDNLLSFFLVHSVVQMRLNLTLCVSYFTEESSGAIGNSPVIKADTL